MISRSTVERTIQLCMETGNVPNLIGDTGVGKSDLVEMIAKKTGRNLILLNLATQEPSDLIGMPSERDGRTHWSLPCWWPKEDGSLIFIDEINRAKKDVINAVFPLILTKKLHVEHELPQDTWICSAMNPDTDEFGLVFSFDDAAFTSRFVHILVEGDLTTWKQWMENGNRDKKFCNLTFDLMEKNRKELVPDTTPITFPFVIKPKWRSLTKFFDIVEYCKGRNLELFDEMVLIARGLLGLEAASAIGSNIHLLLGNGVSVEELLRTPVTTDNAFSIAESMVTLINSKQILTPTLELGDWFLMMGCHHPSVFKMILQKTNVDLMGQMLLFPTYCEAISQASKH